MFKRLVLIAVLGVILSIPFSGTAYAVTVYTSFTMQPTAVQVGEPVTLTNTTVNPTSEPFKYDWGVRNSRAGIDLNFGAGDSRCLNVDCSKAQFVPMQAGAYGIYDGANNNSVNAGVGDEQYLAVYDAEHPLPLQLVSPTTIELPAVLEVLSYSPGVTIAPADCTVPAWIGTYWRYCDPYLLSHTGPNSVGLYRFRFKFAVGPTGSVRLGFGAGSIPFVGSAHGVEYTFNVTKSNEQFGDVITCYKGSGTYSVIYYNTSSSEVVAKLQVRKGKRWITQKRNASAFMPAASTEPEDPFSGSPFELSPWFHRYLYSNFGPVSTLGPKRRVTYEIKHGNKVLEQGLVSKKPCDKKRYF